MKRAIIGSKTCFYQLEWRESDKKSLSDTIKQLKLKGDSYALNVKVVINKKAIYNIAGVKNKEEKNDLKIDNSAAALALCAYQKALKKPEAMNFSSHTIVSSEMEDERNFELGSDVSAKNWVLMFTAEDKETNENGFWVSIIKDGAIWLFMPDNFYESREEIEKSGKIVDEIASIISVNDERSNEYMFISDRKDILDNFKRLFYNANGTKDKIFESALVSFENLVENVKQPALSKIHSTLIDPKYIIGAVALAGVAFGVNYWMDYNAEQEEQYRLMQQERGSEKKKEENLKMQQEYEELKKQTLQETLEEANKELNEAISVGDPQLTIAAWLDEIYKVKLNHNGWLLKEINCSIVKEKVNCNVELARDKLATNKNLMLNYPSAKISGDKATYTIRNEDKINYENKDYLTLPNKQSFLIDTTSTLQKLVLAGVSYSVSNEQEITKNVVLPEPPSKIIRQNMTVDPIKMGVAAGTLKLTGKGAYLLDGLKNEINDPTLKIDKIKLTIDSIGQVSWELTGNYFIKIADNPTLPEIPPSQLGPIGPMDM